MLSYLFVFLAAICSALMDTFIFRVDRSVFKKIGVKKLSPFYTFYTAKTFLGLFKLDAFHIVKLIKIVLIILAVYFYTPLFGFYDLIILWLSWFIGFELFWAKILYKP